MAQARAICEIFLDLSSFALSSDNDESGMAIEIFKNCSF
jgi:hypothetical protein